MDTTSVGESRRPSTPARLPGLDGLRMVSMSLVICSHVLSRRSVFLLDSLWRFDAGGLGVRVFFVISGFLITSLMLKEHAEKGGIDLGRFYLRRILRIMPAYYFYLLIMGAAWRFGLTSMTGRDLLNAALYVTNYTGAPWVFGQTWSLSIEEQFYLIWPCLFWLAGPSRAFRLALPILIVAPALRVAAEFAPTWPWDPRRGFESTCDSIVVGCLLARHRDQLWKHASYRNFLSSRWFLSWPLWIVFVAAVSVLLPRFRAMLGDVILNVSIAVLIDWCVRRPDTIYGRFLNAPPVAFLGVMSYSIYLWQQPFLDKAITLPTGLGLLFTSACAAISHYLVERPFLKLRPKAERLCFGDSDPRK